MWIVHEVNLKPKVSCHSIQEEMCKSRVETSKTNLFSFYSLFFLRSKLKDDFAQSRRREAMNTAREEKKKQTATLDCAFPGGALVSAVGLEAGAILATGGKAGSATSDSVKGGSGASAGGK